ncbi:ultraviolet-B receptor UVR8 isoform X2 [Magnolia sinica]|uniref:ultraviolet-B receptor UVR8 isoform X2 n=1 Tax=Magnolia sinica TaxID=86752 RepID=UPI002657F946|nr:ultraviolet-B receptor UVR8 isoform X2 [Magnolia sinica]
MWRSRACLEASRSAPPLTSCLGFFRRWISSGSRVAALWGNGDYGRLGLGNLNSQWKPSICPAFNGNGDGGLRAIACGGAHTLFLTEKGHVYATGLNDFGQLGISSERSHVLEPLEVSGIPKEVIQISAGYRHSSVVTVDGELYMWGNNSSGQLGLGRGAEKIVSTPRRLDCLDGFHIKMVSLGSEHSFAITDEGDALSWGAGGSGRLGHGHQSGILGFLRSSSEYTPRLIKNLEGVKVTKIAVGLLHSACISGEGELYTWGSNENGCLGLGGTDAVHTPLKVEGSLLKFPVSEVSCGWKHTAAISGGNLFTWGWGGSHGTFSIDGHSSGGQLGHGNDIDYFEPMMVNLGKEWKALQVSCGFNHTGAIFEYSEA